MDSNFTDEQRRALHATTDMLAEIARSFQNAANDRGMIIGGGTALNAAVHLVTGTNLTEGIEALGEALTDTPLAPTPESRALMRRLLGEEGARAFLLRDES